MSSKIDFSVLKETQIAALFSVTQLLAKTEMSTRLIEEALDWVVTVICAERAVFARYNSKTDSFQIISARNIEKEKIGRASCRERV